MLLTVMIVHPICFVIKTMIVHKRTDIGKKGEKKFKEDISPVRAKTITISMIIDNNNVDSHKTTTLT